MFELIYRSIADPNITDTDISNILITSRDFNSKHNITGCLLFHNNEFIQILEGDEKIIQELYARIEKDIRHTDVRLVYTGTKEDRMFNGWSLAYHKLNGSDLEEITKMNFENNIITMASLPEDRSEAVKLFWYMAKQLMAEN